MPLHLNKLRSNIPFEFKWVIFLLCMAVLLSYTLNQSFSQIMIILFGVTTAYLASSKNKWCVVTGLISQPFWIYSTYQTIDTNWGMFVLTIYYTITWLRSIKTWWLI